MGSLLHYYQTPCTSPFIASFLNKAIAADMPTLFVFFISVALGMSSPYFLRAFFSKNEVMSASEKTYERIRTVAGISMLISTIWFISFIEGTHWINTNCNYFIV